MRTIASSQSTMAFPVNLLPDGPKLDTKRALILLDFQNDFLSPKGNLYVPNVLSILPRLPGLVERFREKNEVAWVNTEFNQPRANYFSDSGGYAVVLGQFLDQLRASKDNGDDDSNGYPREVVDTFVAHGADQNGEHRDTPDAEAFLAAQIPENYQRCCSRGSWGAQMPSRLADCIDRQRDIQVVKSDYSALADMNFILQLRTRLVTDLYICGSLSNISVYATVVDAVRQGFNVTLVEDCLGFRDEACHVESITQMADTLGADGIDLQELMDDLAGMLGDVVQESDFPTSFQVSMQPRSRSKSGMSHTQKINEWMSSMEKEVSESTYTEEDVRIAPNIRGHGAYLSTKSHGKDESSSNIKHERKSSNASPPRKRSTSERDESDEKRLSPSSQHLYTRRASHDTYEPSSRSSAKKSRSRRLVEPSHHPSQASPPPTRPKQLAAFGQSRSTGDLPDSPVMEDSHSTSAHTQAEGTKSKKMKKQALTFLGPGDRIGEGDSSVVYNVLGKQAAEEAFHSLRSNVRWQKMYHRSGEVPRLVAVQGDTFANGSIIPIYRHPADESPELLPFDDTVNKLRQACEKVVKHPLNHVLIQYYRNSEDNISEHSDKTLDIVRGSSIVNLSLGAMRTMMLRTKKSNVTSSTSIGDTSVTDPSQNVPRASQRIQLPHDSVFILGQTTNANYLHSIRADKRPVCEKSPEELAYNCERISLTFRHIGTFIDTKRGMIWGQGARGKTQDEARKILKAGTITADREGEEMIIAFGKENHLSAYRDGKSKPHRNDNQDVQNKEDDSQGFSWELEYGSGFDVVNFVVRPV